MAAPMRMAAVGSRPKIRRDSPPVRGDADAVSLPELLRRSVFTSTLVDELDDERSVLPTPGVSGRADGADVPGSGAAVLDDEVDDDVALSSAGLVASLWALDEVPGCWAITEPPTPRMSNALRTATDRDFIVAPPHSLPATAVPTRQEKWA
jgi:hypothetical protein